MRPVRRSSVSTRTRAELRGWEYDLLRRHADDARQTLPIGEVVGGLHWLSEDTLVVAKRHGGIDLWSVAKSAIVRSLPNQEGRLVEMVPVGDGSRAVIARQRGANTQVELVDLASGKTVRTLAEMVPYWEALCVSPDGQRFAAHSKRVLQIGWIDGRQPPTRWEDVKVPVRSLAFWPDGESLVLGTLNGFLGRAGFDRQFIDPRFADPKAPTLTTMATRLLADPERGVLVAGSLHRIAVFEMATGSLRYTIPVPVNVTGLRVEAGVLYACGGWSTAMVGAWDLTTGARIGSFDGHRLGVTELALSPSRGLLATGGEDGTVKIWDARPREDARVLQIGLDVRDVHYDVAHDRLAYCSQDGRAVVRDLRSLDAIMDFDLRERGIVAEQCAIHGNRLYFVGSDGVARVIDVARSEVTVQAELVPGDGQVSDVTASRDGSVVGVASYGAQTIYVLSARDLTVRWQHSFGSLRQPPFRVWFSPDGEQLFGAYYDGHLTVFDAADGTVGETIRFDDGVHDLEWSPDGRAIVVCVATGEVVELEPEGLRRVRSFAPHKMQAFSAAISPDGSRLATTGPTGRVRIHDFATGVALVELDVAERASHGLAWSPDGRRLFARSHQWYTPSQLIVWDAGSAAEASK